MARGTTAATDSHHIDREGKSGDALLLKIPTKTITVALTLTALFLTLASLTAQGLNYMGYMGALGESQLSLARLFNVGEEANIPTYYSSFILLISSMLLAIIAGAKKRRGERYALHWAVLSIIFLGMSLDETAQIHETSGYVFETLAREYTGFTPSGFLYSSWVIPGIVFVLVVGLAYLPFLAHLPRKTCLLFLIAGFLYVGGAVGLEMIGGKIVSAYGWENWEDWKSVADSSNMVGAKVLANIEQHAEELLEMLGVTVFIYALLSYISSYVGGVTLQVRDGKE
jgi:hypothetical protein